MNIEIFIKKKETAGNYNDSSIIYNKLENEYGEYYELDGQVIIKFDDDNIITIETITLESDLYSFFYSISDYIEFGFARILFNVEEVQMRYHKFEEGKLSIEVFGKTYFVTEKDFFFNLLNAVSKFFEKLYFVYSDNKYKMYLETINGLKEKLVLN